MQGWVLNCMRERLLLLSLLLFLWPFAVCGFVLLAQLLDTIFFLQRFLFSEKFFFDFERFGWDRPNGGELFGSPASWRSDSVKRCSGCSGRAGSRTSRSVHRERLSVRPPDAVLRPGRVGAADGARLAFVSLQRRVGLAVWLVGAMMVMLVVVVTRDVTGLCDAGHATVVVESSSVNGSRISG